jgi:hypothetical protein
LLPRRALSALPAALLLCAGVFVLGYAGALVEPFFSDDYILIDKVRRVPFAELFAPSGLAYGYWRPWSRELHYWVLDTLSGGRSPVFHAVSLALWLAAMALYWTLVRRLASARAATLALAGVLALAAWGVPLRWAPGAQDLWMLVFALLTLHLVVRGRAMLAAITLAFALLSKEHAAVVPLVALALPQQGRSRIRSMAPMLAVVVSWAVVHPALGGRWLWPDARAMTPTPAANPGLALLRTLLSMINLDLAPQPVLGWLTALALAAPVAALLFFAAFRSPEAGEATEANQRRDVLRFGIAWALIGWLPLAAPSLLWQPYYTLLGALGLWLALGALLEKRATTAAGFIAAIALLRVARADTPSEEWGNERLMAFGKRFMAVTQEYVLKSVPPPAPESRFFFAGVPSGVVFVLGPGDAPALRVWYRDTTVSGSYWSQYNAPASATGHDYFFRYDAPTWKWSTVTAGPESIQTDDPVWQADHETLALTFTNGDDHARAAAEYAKLARVFVERADYPFLAGLSFEAAADTAAARDWYRTAITRPGADSSMKARARALGVR